MSVKTKAMARWRAMSPRERLITVATTVCLAIALSKMAIYDPATRRSQALRAELASKNEELVAASLERQRLMAEAKVAGSDGASAQIAKLRGESAALSVRMGQASDLILSGDSALSLLESLSAAAGSGLRELALPEGSAPSSAAMKAAPMVYEHKIKLTVAGDWSAYKKVLASAKKASSALKLQRVSFERNAKGESLMTAEFSALSMDSAWRLPAARRAP